jgi:hypothetical protein
LECDFKAFTYVQPSTVLHFAQTSPVGLGQQAQNSLLQAHFSPQLQPFLQAGQVIVLLFWKKTQQGK